MKVVTYNIQYGLGKDNRYDLARIAREIEAPSEGGAWCGGHPEPEAGLTEGEMPPMPVDAILLGDFNFERDAPEYARIVGPVITRYGRWRKSDDLDWQ